MALACDLTRVGTIQWERSVGDVRFTWLGITRGHHAISHDPDTNTDSVELLTKINIWYAEQFAYLLDKLASIKEGTGTMLDNTLVFWCNELSRGNAHSHPDMPFVLAGRAGGALKTGRFLQFPEEARGPAQQLARLDHERHGTARSRPAATLPTARAHLGDGLDAQNDAQGVWELGARIFCRNPKILISQTPKLPVQPTKG